jgi:hypothetical protein
MTSNINFGGINENFPIAGQDNDTQVFRDNFNLIKENFRNSYNEITALQANAAKLNEDNDFAGSIISGAVFVDNRDRVHSYSTIAESTPQAVYEVDYGQGPYQKFTINKDINLQFTNFPVSTGVGKVTLELYGDGTERTITLIAEGGTQFKRSKVTTSTGATISFPNPLKVTSSTNPTIIEVWQYNSNTIYLNYVGVFE